LTTKKIMKIKSILKKIILSKLLWIDSLTQQNIKVSHRNFASFLVCLSGLILYLDKVFMLLEIEFVMPKKFIHARLDFSTFLWLLMQSISPVMLIIGSILKPYVIFYIVPIYCYSLQFYFILFDYRIIDDDYVSVYSIGTSILVFVSIIGLKRWLNYRFKTQLSAIKKSFIHRSKNEFRES